MPRSTAVQPRAGPASTVLPAVTRRAGSTGSGAAYYVATSLGREGLAELVQLLCSDAGVEPVLGVRPPEDVEIVRRSNGTKDWTFVINHRARTCGCRSTASNSSAGRPPEVR